MTSTVSLPLFLGGHRTEQNRWLTPRRAVIRVANLVLTQTIERLFHPPSRSYAQTDRGVFLIRGENVVLLGEIVSPRSLVTLQFPG